jgi:hypothetical protein
MKRLLYIVLVLAAGLMNQTPTKAAWVPSGYQSVVNSDSVLQPWGKWRAQHQLSIGGQIWHYPNGGVWQPISNTWVQSGSGANRKWTCNTDVLKVEQNRAGRTLFTVTWDDTTYTMIYQLNGFVLEDTLTGAVVEGFSAPATFGTPVISGDTLRWVIYSGVIFEVIKQNGNVIHRYTMEPAFSLWAVEQAQLHPEWAGCAVATDVDITLTNIANPTGTKHGTTLKQWQHYALEMGGQWLEYDGQPDSVEFPVMQGWAAGQFRERVNVNRMDAIMTGNASAKIRHNDQVSIGNGSIDDAQLNQIFGDRNYGVLTVITVSEAAYDYNSVIRPVGVGSTLGVGATNITGVCSLKCSGNYSDGNTNVYAIWKNQWVKGDENGTDNDDGDVTWNDWASDANEWTTAGCMSATDTRTYNTGDGTGGDRALTAESIVNVTTTNTWYSWAISTTTATEWYGQASGQEGGLLLQTGIASNDFASSENATAANRPRFSFTFETGGAPPAAASVGQVIVVEE